MTDINGVIFSSSLSGRSSFLYFIHIFFGKVHLKMVGRDIDGDFADISARVDGGESKPQSLCRRCAKTPISMSKHFLQSIYSITLNFGAVISFL